MNPEVSTLQRVLRVKQICELLNIPKPTLYRMMQNGEFPKPFKIGRRATGWTEVTIAAWIATKQAKGAK